LGAPELLSNILHFLYSGFSVCVFGAVVMQRISLKATNTVKDQFSFGLVFICFGVVAGAPLVSFGMASSKTLEIFAVFISASSQIALAFLAVGVLLLSSSRFFPSTM
jgi:hypothetical protein